MVKIVSQFVWSLIVIRWDESFLSHLDDNAYDQEIKTFQEAIQSLENVQHFLESQGLLQHP